MEQHSLLLPTRILPLFSEFVNRFEKLYPRQPLLYGMAAGVDCLVSVNVCEYCAAFFIDTKTKLL